MGWYRRGWFIKSYCESEEFISIKIPTDNLIKNIFELYQDSKGTIWIGTEENLSRLNVSNNTVENISENADKKSIYAIQKDKQGQLWIGTESDGIIVLDSNTHLDFKILFSLSLDELNGIFF